jgi:hypothetical protein
MTTMAVATRVVAAATAQATAVAVVDPPVVEVPLVVVARPVEEALREAHKQIDDSESDEQLT